MKLYFNLSYIPYWIYILLLSLSIDVSLVDDDSEIDDPDFEPSFDITACL